MLLRRNFILHFHLFIAYSAIIIIIIIIIIINAICNAQDPFKKAANALSGSLKMLVSIYNKC